MHGHFHAAGTADMQTDYIANLVQRATTLSFLQAEVVTWSRWSLALRVPKASVSQSLVAPCCTGVSSTPSTPRLTRRRRMWIWVRRSRMELTGSGPHPMGTNPS